MIIIFYTVKKILRQLNVKIQMFFGNKNYLYLIAAIALPTINYIYGLAASHNKYYRYNNYVYNNSNSNHFIIIIILLSYRNYD